LDPDSIDRIRSATFPTARRGYDTREVDGFLNKLADWLETGGDDQARVELVRRELDRIGDQTGKILTDAHDAGEQLRAEAEDEARRIGEETRLEADRVQAAADEYASEARAAADSYATQTRAEADRDAEQMVERARAEARRIVDEAARRRRDVEAVISDLEHRRDAAIAEMRRLSSELAGTATHHGAPEDGGAQEAVAEKPG
jgi:DivIVA domain-containing protein